MQKLMSELRRLYLPAGTGVPDVLERRLLGNSTELINLADEVGLVRAAMIPFKKLPHGDEAQHWTLLCAAANALQTELGLPAPAVSISGSDGYGLWLSLKSPVRAEKMRTLVGLLRAAYFPGGDDAVCTDVELPPCLNRHSGKWAAFIHPGLGASFADEAGLDMPPPLAGQISLLEGLHSISDEQLAHALTLLRRSHPAPAAATEQPGANAAARDGLLLAEATIEDIVRHLHAQGIEPTFRHLLRDR